MSNEPCVFSCPFRKVRIKFKFVYDESNEPVENVKVLIKLPDGTEKPYTSNKQGLIDIENIQPGILELASNWKFGTSGTLENTLDFVQ